ncbi:MAG: HK97 gp10 family phage protein, partial [Clostridia bacterium]|nr:HK97 gp10 family phage protein [Clostridia bacterium]
MNSSIKVEGLAELKKSIKLLGKLPQSCVTAAARSGASLALKYARSEAPELSGDLKSGIILKGEKKTKQGKKMYQVTMDPSMNDTFVKMSKDGKTRWYYPASQEYGFTVRGKYTPGFNYMKKSIED